LGEFSQEVTGVFGDNKLTRAVGYNTDNLSNYMQKSKLGRAMSEQSVGNLLTSGTMAVGQAVDTAHTMMKEHANLKRMQFALTGDVPESRKDWHPLIQELCKKEKIGFNQKGLSTLISTVGIFTNAAMLATGKSNAIVSIAAGLGTYHLAKALDPGNMAMDGFNKLSQYFDVEGNKIPDAAVPRNIYVELITGFVGESGDEKFNDWKLKAINTFHREQLSPTDALKTIAHMKQLPVQIGTTKIIAKTPQGSHAAGVAARSEMPELAGAVRGS